MVAKCFCGGSTAPFLQNGLPVRGSWRESSATLVGCEDCGYLVFDPLPGEDVLTAYYRSDYWSPDAARSEARVAYETGAYADQAADIKALIEQHGTGARIHEIGCGFGATVHHLNKLGLEATGSDLSEASIAIARELGNERVVTAPFGGYLRGGERHDVFFMSHSLEHHIDPREPVRAAYENLHDGGLLIIRVPNALHAPSRSFSLYEYTWLQYPDHIHYFTPVSLTALLEDEGMEVVSVGCLPREDRPDLTLSALVGLQTKDLPDPAALLSALYANGLGMELQAVARKTGRRGTAADRFRLLEKARPERPQAAPPSNVARPGAWRYTVGGRALPLSDDGRTWHAPTAWVARDHMLVRGELTAHARTEEGLNRLRVDLWLSCPTRVTVTAGGRLLYDRRETRQRVYLERFVLGRPEEDVSVRLEPDEHPWPAINFHADVSSLSVD